MSRAQAELLLEAAGILRAAAADATPGPWIGSRPYGSVIAAASYAGDLEGDVEGYAGALVCESVQAHNARVIVVAQPLPALLAAHFEVTPRTVSRWVDSGRLRAVILPSGHRRILREDIDRIVAAVRVL